MFGLSIRTPSMCQIILKREVFSMKRFMALVLVVLAAMLFTTVAFAENDNSRASDYFSGYGITLSKPGSNKINITFSCTAVGTASQIGVSTYSVQRYLEDSGLWATVSGPHNGSYSYNASSHSFAKTFQGVAGEKYRVKCTFTCSKDGTFESKSYTSRSVTLP